jgi:hypothetical protein
MKETIRDEVNKLKERVDVVFLGYGYCQSLKGFDEEFDFPVILPQVDDCITLLLTPERYAEEIKKEVGTWFMTPGWAEVGADMVIKELHLDRAERYGKKPLDMARRLFTHYKRGLYEWIIFCDSGKLDFLALPGTATPKVVSLRLRQFVPCHSGVSRPPGNGFLQHED